MDPREAQRIVGKIQEALAAARAEAEGPLEIVLGEYEYDCLRRATGQEAPTELDGVSVRPFSPRRWLSVTPVPVPQSMPTDAEAPPPSGPRGWWTCPACGAQNVTRVPAWITRLTQWACAACGEPFAPWSGVPSYRPGRRRKR